MNEKRKYRLKKGWIVPLLMVCMIGNGMGKIQESYGSEVIPSSLVMTQSAAWTEEAYKGEVTVKISGCKTSDLQMTWEEALEGKTEDMSEETGTVKEPEYTEEAGISEAPEYTEEAGISEAPEYTEEASISEAPEHIEEAGISKAPEHTEEASISEEAGNTENLTAVESGKASEAEGENPLFLVYFLPKYFSIIPDQLPKECVLEEILVSGSSNKQETATKLTCPVRADEEGNWQFSFPVSLREAYRISQEEKSYSTAKPLPVIQEQSGSGIYLVQKNQDGLLVLAQADAQSLSVKGTRIGLGASLESVPQGKAGELLEVRCKLSNESVIPLHQIQFQASFSEKEIRGTWESSDGFEGGDAGSPQLIETLAEGESRTCSLMVSLPESQKNPLHILVKVKAPDPSMEGGWMEREAQIQIPVTPLIADYTVEKTADRTIAYPGDEITYQICIRNTGERTLHSVVSTERFLTAGISAQFLPKDGVTLNSSGTQALISKIEPGEAFALEAKVVVPQNMQSQELINQVSVVTAETGSRSVQSRSGVQLYVPSPTPVPSVTPGVFQAGFQSKNGGSMSKSASSYPKTRDESRTELYVGLLGAALGTGGIAVLCRKLSRKKKRCC